MIYSVLKDLILANIGNLKVQASIGKVAIACSAICEAMAEIPVEDSG
jgi:hypothetical protein